MTKVIFLTIECFRKDYFKKENTPYLFNLSKKGIFFENAYPTGPWTPASVTGILTSTYPLMYNENIQLSKKTKSIAEVLKDKGYKTVVFSVGGWLSSYFNFVKGFDEVIYSQEEKEKGAFGKFRRILAEVKGRIYRIFPKLREIYRLLYLILKAKGWKGSVDKKQIERAINWINKNKEKDFFLWIHLEDSHEPYMFGSTREVIRANYNFFKTRKELSKKDIDLSKRLFKNGLKSVDDNISHFIETLKEKNLLEDTYFVICGDHGHEIYDRSSFGHGPDFYQENINIPLILMGPKIKSKQEKKIVGLIDISPTILNLLKIKKPEQFLGQDLLGKEREYLIIEDARKQNLQDPNMAKVKYDLKYFKAAIIKGNYKYIYKKIGKDELYDLKKDPKEKKNLINEKKELVTKLKKEIMKHIYFEEKTRENKEEIVYKKEDEEKVRKRLEELGYM